MNGGESSTPSSKRGRPRQQSLTFTRYPPLKDTADDSITVSRNLEALHKEIQKGNPNKEKVLSLLRQTFHKRREDILDDFDGNTATDLLEKYGELHRSYVVLICVSVLCQKFCGCAESINWQGLGFRGCPLLLTYHFYITPC